MGGCKGLTGKILSADEDSVVLFVPDEEREVAVPFANIRSGSLVFRGFEPQAPKKRKKGGRAGSDGGRRMGEDKGKHHEEEL